MSRDLLDFYRGLIIVKPYGSYIRDGSKSLVVKSRLLPSIVEEELLLIENKLGLGLVVLSEPKKITIKQFQRLYPSHLISEEDRKKWWPKYNNLFAYEIIRKSFFRIPILLNYPTGPQITVQPHNITTKKILIGMSGYRYGWMYPKGVNMLDFYSKLLSSVEINSTFYRLPSKSLVRNLNKFNLRFCIKVSRYITHSKRLKDFNKHWKKFYRKLKSLYEKIFCFLFQFPPNFVFNSENFARLENLSSDLDDQHRYAFEFRHKSWFNPKLDTLFRKNMWTLVISNTHGDWIDMAGFNPRLSNYHITSDMIYLRMHGSRDQYVGSYDDDVLNNIVKFVRGAQVNYACIFFNNTDSGKNALKDAQRLQSKFNSLNVV